MARPRTPTAADPKRPLSSRSSPEHQGHFCVRPMVGRMSCRCSTCPRWLMRRGMGARVQPMTRACVTLGIRGEKSVTRVVRSMECRSHRYDGAATGELALLACAVGPRRGVWREPHPWNGLRVPVRSSTRGGAPGAYRAFTRAGDPRSGCTRRASALVGFGNFGIPNTDWA